MLNLADIAGAGTTVTLASPNITARWVLIVASGGGTARIGGANVTSALGLPLYAGGSLMLPPISQGDSPPPYSLHGTYAYIPVGVTLSIAYEPYN